jgi:hypothetical protein
MNSTSTQMQQTLRQLESTMTDITPEKSQTKTLWTCSVCGGTDVACDARINPNTGEVFCVFDDPDATCDKCGEVELDVVETNAAEEYAGKKELFAFIWPFQLMPRNATDEQIVKGIEILGKLTHEWIKE